MAERMTWQEIQLQYPDQWVGLTDGKYLNDVWCAINAYGGIL